MRIRRWTFGVAGLAAAIGIALLYGSLSSNSEIDALPVGEVVSVSGSSGSADLGPVDVTFDFGVDGTGEAAEAPPVATTDVSVLPEEAAVAAVEDLGGETLTVPIDISAFDANGEQLTSFPHSYDIVADETGHETVENFEPGLALKFSVSDAALEGIEPSSVRVATRESDDAEWVVVPSALNPETNVVTAHVDHLSAFIVIGERAIDNPDGPRIVLDTDNDLAWAKWNGVTVSELPYSFAVAQSAALTIAESCPTVGVLVTRDTSEPIVDQDIRAQLAANFDPDIFLTVAMNSTDGSPWGDESDGGPNVWTADPPGDEVFGQAVIDHVLAFTGRKVALPRTVNERPGGRFPYVPFRGIAPIVAHGELMFLNHNYDWPVLNDPGVGTGAIGDAVATAVLEQLERDGADCEGGLPWPEPPDAATLERWRDLGMQSYQMFGADPVNFVTGNFVNLELLFQLPGVGDQLTEMALMYNSQDGRDGPFGVGWSSTLGSWVQGYADGSAMVVLADGHSGYFTYDEASGEFATPAGWFGALSWLDDDHTTLEWHDESGETLVFSTNADSGRGVLVSETNRTGLTRTYTYGDPIEAGWIPIASVVDEAGQTVDFASDAEGRVTSITHPDGSVWTLTYDGPGNLATIAQPGGGTRAFSYDDKHQLVSVTDESGAVTVANTYDDDGRVVSQSDASGSQRSIAYGEGVTTFTDDAGRISTYEWDSDARLTGRVDGNGDRVDVEFSDSFQRVGTTDANGYSESLTYDDAGRLVSTEDPNGVLTTFEYDDAGHLVAYTDTAGADGATRRSEFTVSDNGLPTTVTKADGTQWAYTYTETGDVLTETDPLGGVTTHVYDERGNRISTTDPEGNTTTWTYDLANRVTSQTDPESYTSTYAYGAHGRLIEAVDSEGGATLYGYDAMGRLIQQTDPAGGATTLTWDDEWNLTSVTTPEDNITTYGYDEAGNVVSTTDSTGFVTTYEYDATDNLISVTDPAGAVVSYEYDAEGSLIEETDPLGNVLSYGYNANRQVTSITDANGDTANLDYDSGGRLVSMTDPLGNATSYDYGLSEARESVTYADGTTIAYTHDPLGRTIGVTDQVGKEWTFTYDLAGRLISETDPTGASTSVTYDGRGFPIQTTDQIGEISTASYDGRGSIINQTDPMGATTSFGYDPRGLLMSITDPGGATTSYAHNGDGRLLSTTDPEGGVTAFTYDGRGLPVATTDPDGHEWSSAYDSRGFLTTSTDPLGNETHYDYDLAGRLIAERDPEGGETLYGYDPTGRVTSVTDQLGAATEFVFDAANRMIEVRDPVGGVTAMTYDSVGRRVGVADPMGATSAYSYDPRGLLTKRVDEAGFEWARSYDDRGLLASSTDPLGGTRTYSYDPRGLLTGEADEKGATTSYGYDARRLLISTVDAVGAKTSYGHDSRRLVTSVIDALGAETTVSYDLAGRLVSQADSLGNTTSWSYNARGLATSMTDPEGSTESYSYDAASRLISATDPLGASQTFGYDGRGLLVSRVDQAGHEWGVGYDAAGRPVSYTDPLGNATSIAYDAAGRAVSETNPAGEALAWAYDAAGRVVSETLPTGDARSYGYDPRGFLTSTVDPLGNSTSSVFDGAGRRTSTTDPAGTVTAYGYDPVGRLTTVTENAGGAIAPADVLTSYGYDPVGGLTSVVNAEGATTGYGYDLVGQLVSETDPLGSTRAFSYDLAGRLISDTNPDGQTVSYGYDRRSALTSMVVDTPDGSESYSYAHDAAGRVVEAAGPAGTVGFSYDPRGLAISESQPGIGSFGFGYDEAGRRTSMKYPDGSIVGFSYDAASRVTGIDTVYGSAGVAYDGAGRITGVNRTNGVDSAYSYDAAGRMLALTHQGPLSPESLPKGNNGNANESASGTGWVPGGGLPSAPVPELAFDPLGIDEVSDRPYTPIQAPAPDADPIAAFILVAALAGLGVVVVSRRQRGVVVAAAFAIAVPLVTVTTPAYAASSSASSVVDVASIRDLVSGPSLTARVQPSGGEFSLSYGYSYDPVGQVTTEVEDTNGAVSSTGFSYDGLGRVVEAASDTGRVETFAYDLVGNRTISSTNAWAGLLGVEVEQTFTYDAASRLVSTETVLPGVTDGTGNGGGQGDGEGINGEGNGVGNNGVGSGPGQGAGNGQGLGWTNGTNGYGNGNLPIQLPPAGTTTYDYDQTGRRISETDPNGNVTSLAWDARNQARSITSDAGNVDYGYDGLGRRVQESWSNTGTGVSGELRVGFDGQNPTVFDDGTDAISQVWGPRGVLVQSTSGRLDGDSDRYGTGPVGDFTGHLQPGVWRLEDNLRSTIGVASNHGIIGWSVSDYSTYGVSDAPRNTNKTVSGWAGLVTESGYTGISTQPGFGYSEFHARLYDPATATWLSPDSWRGDPFEPLTLNRSLYVVADPVNHIDDGGYGHLATEEGYDPMDRPINVNPTASANADYDDMGRAAITEARNDDARERMYDDMARAAITEARNAQVLADQAADDMNDEMGLTGDDAVTGTEIYAAGAQMVNTGFASFEDVFDPAYLRHVAARVANAKGDLDRMVGAVDLGEQVGNDIVAAGVTPRQHRDWQYTGGAVCNHPDPEYSQQCWEDFSLHLLAEEIERRSGDGLVSTGTMVLTLDMLEGLGDVLTDEISTTSVTISYTYLESTQSYVLRLPDGSMMSISDTVGVETITAIVETNTSVRGARGTGSFFRRVDPGTVLRVAKWAGFLGDGIQVIAATGDIIDACSDGRSDSRECLDAVGSNVFEFGGELAGTAAGAGLVVLVGGGATVCAASIGCGIAVLIVGAFGGFAGSKIGGGAWDHFFDPDSDDIFDAIKKIARPVPFA